MERKCKCCGKDVAGYIKRAGHGLLLDNLCKKCWLKGGDIELAGKPYTPDASGYVSIKDGRS